MMKVIVENKNTCKIQVERSKIEIAKIPLKAMQKKIRELTHL
jgi:hypothetical protein